MPCFWAIRVVNIWPRCWLGRAPVSTRRAAPSIPDIYFDVAASDCAIDFPSRDGPSPRQHEHYAPDLDVIYASPLDIYLIARYSAIRRGTVVGFVFITGKMATGRRGVLKRPLSDSPALEAREFDAAGQHRRLAIAAGGSGRKQYHIRWLGVLTISRFRLSSPRRRRASSLRRRRHPRRSMRAANSADVSAGD